MRSPRLTWDPRAQPACFELTASIHGSVYLLREPPTDPAHHESVSRQHVASRIADLLGVELGERHASGTCYAVAPRTLLCAEAIRLGIHGPEDLFGGVVPHAFIATKAITHALVTHDAAAPAGWDPRLGRLLADTVLPGYSAFTVEDACVAARRIAPSGVIRLKRVDARGGHGQWVARGIDDFRAALDCIDRDEIGEHGVVVEQHVDAATTYSVGSVVIGTWSIAYIGRQREVDDHRGRKVYGGSELLVVRGGFSSLASLEVSTRARDAVRKARAYDAAVGEVHPQFFASRRNYDVVCGTDANGNACSGVLEQSWRVGGASPAELAAMHAFKADPALRVVVASTHESYGNQLPPTGSAVHYRDCDGRIGGLLKYVTCEADGRPAQDL